MPATPHLTPLDAHPLDEAAELMAIRHHITPEEARWRLERIAASLGISDGLIARLIILAETRET